MNQAQWVGERLVRDDPQWSPLAFPFENIADALLSATRAPDDHPTVVVLAALTGADHKLTFTEVREACGLSKTKLSDKLRVLVANYRVVQSGPRKHYLYHLPGRFD